MEENEITKTNFVLSDESEAFLKETAKWGYFLSILGFVFIGIIVLMAFFIGAFLSKMDSFGGNPMGGSMSIIGNLGGFFGFIYLVLAAIYFFPVYYLFQFSSKVKTAFRNNDNDKLNESFQFLKSHYKFIGVLALLFLVLYGGIICIFGLISLL